MVRHLFILFLFLVSCKKESTIKPTPHQQLTQAVSVIGDVKFYYLAEPSLNIGTGIEIYVNGTYKGKITNAPTSIPECTDIFGFVYSDTAMVYNYTAKVVDAFPSSHNFIKSGTFELVANSCSKINTHP